MSTVGVGAGIDAAFAGTVALAALGQLGAGIVNMFWATFTKAKTTQQVRTNRLLGPNATDKH